MIKPALPTRLPDAHEAIPFWIDRDKAESIRDFRRRFDSVPHDCRVIWQRMIAYCVVADREAASQRVAITSGKVPLSIAATLATPEQLGVLLAQRLIMPPVGGGYHIAEWHAAHEERMSTQPATVGAGERVCVLR